MCIHLSLSLSPSLPRSLSLSHSSRGSASSRISCSTRYAPLTFHRKSSTSNDAQKSKAK